MHVHVCLSIDNNNEEDTFKNKENTKLFIIHR